VQNLNSNISNGDEMAGNVRKIKGKVFTAVKSKKKVNLSP
jgi:hypothetical protein